MLAVLSGKGLLQNYVPNSIDIIGFFFRLSHFIAPCNISVSFSSPPFFQRFHLSTAPQLTPNTTPEGFPFYPTRSTFRIHENVVLCLCVNLPHSISTQRFPSNNGRISRPQSKTKQKKNLSFLLTSIHTVPRNVNVDNKENFMAPGPHTPNRNQRRILP